jgi:hypothetical protein
VLLSSFVNGNAIPRLTFSWIQPAPCASNPVEVVSSREPRSCSRNWGISARSLLPSPGTHVRSPCIHTLYRTPFSTSLIGFIKTMLNTANAGRAEFQSFCILTEYLLFFFAGILPAGVHSGLHPKLGQYVPVQNEPANDDRDQYKHIVHSDSSIFYQCPRLTGLPILYYFFCFKA